MSSYLWLVHVSDAVCLANSSCLCITYKRGKNPHWLLSSFHLGGCKPSWLTIALVPFMRITAHLYSSRNTDSEKTAPLLKTTDLALVPRWLHYTNLLPQSTGCGGSVVGSVPCVQKVAGSNPSLPITT